MRNAIPVQADQLMFISTLGQVARDLPQTTLRTIKFLIKFFVAASVLMVAAIIGLLVWPQADPGAKFQTAAPPEDQPTEAFRPGGPARDFSSYQPVFSRRDLFNWPQQADQAAETVAASVGNIEELRRTLQIVGIMLDNQPQVAIKDLNNSTTVFLTVGERIGDAEVIAIHDGQITLGYNGQTIEMTP